MPSFTDRELDLMNVLWDLGSGTVAEVREKLTDDLAYTTVLSLLRTLEAKGFLRHEGEGKAHRYFPTVARHEAEASGVKHLVDKVFQGSAEALLTQLVSDRGLSREKLAKMRALLDERLGEPEKHEDAN
ncbi:MAG: Penicillinase repressor [Gemmatimonadetes bacterium]|nr:Penicillinase repressor [Gemmatimonadota bacterium]